jgi:hypothetical protein
MDRAINRWAAGPSCAYMCILTRLGLQEWTDGPVLQQTQLYILQAALDLNPILEGKHDQYQLQFHIVTGFTTGNSRGPNGDHTVQGKDEPATLPRVDQLIIISRYSPWCTIVRNDAGVTVGDVCSAIYKE